MADISLIITNSFGYSNNTVGANLSVISENQVITRKETPINNAKIETNSFGYSFLPGGSPEISIVSINPLRSRFSEAVNTAISISEDITYEKDSLYYAEFDDTIPIKELAMFDGIASNDYIDESITVSDEIETGNVKFSIEIDDDITLQDQFIEVVGQDELIKIYDSVVTQQFFAEAQKVISGTQFFMSSEHPSPMTFVHVFKRYSHPIMVDFTGVTDTVELILTRGGSVISDEVIDGGSVPVGPEPEPRFLPDGNLPNNYGLSDANGQFVLQGLSLGVYVLVSVKKGYTVGWKKIDVADDTTKMDLYLAPLNSWNYVERVYNLQGHSFKMYHISNYINEADGTRVVDGLLIFGDIYAEGDPAGTPIVSDGYLEIDTDYNPGQILLMPLPDLGYNGFFVPENGESVVQSDDKTRISWVTDVSARVFKGFAFRLRGLPDRSIILNLSIATGGIKMPYGDGASGAGGGGGGGGDGGSGGAGGGGSSPQGTGPGTWDPYDRKVPRDEKGLGVPYVPPAWDPVFSISLSDGFALGEQNFDTDVTRGGIRTRSMLFTDALQIDEGWGTPVPLSMTGIALDDQGNPVVGAKVHLIAVRNGVIAGFTTSDINGIWKVTNLQSELEYRVVVSAPLLGLHSASGTVLVYDKDIVDSRAWVYLEAQSLSIRGYLEFFDARIILPPMTLTSVTDRRIWGEVYDENTGVSISGVLVEAFEGTLTESQILKNTGKIYSDVTGVRSEFVDGYYEIYLPPGDYTLRASKNNYVESALFHVTLVGGTHQDIPITAILVTGIIYEKEAYDATGEIIPIAGATITSGGYSATSGADGKYNLDIPFEKNVEYSVVCAATRYQTQVKVLIARTDTVTGFDFAMTPALLYPKMGE